MARLEAQDLAKEFALDAAHPSAGRNELTEHHSTFFKQQRAWRAPRLKDNRSYVDWTRLPPR
jgi:hypothetical protein